MEEVERQKQPFGFYVVLDFEANGNNSQRFGPCEIIEFPSVVLDSETLEIVEEFQLFVNPSQPLNEFCIAKTAITQQMVSEGVSFREAMSMYSSWLTSREYLQHSTFTLLTCGDWDLKTQIPQQCQRENVEVPEFFKSFVNIKIVYNAFYKRKIRGMAGMLKELGMELEGHHHRGIDDCRNIAAILKRMILDGAVVPQTFILGQQHPPFTLLLN